MRMRLSISLACGIAPGMLIGGIDRLSVRQASIAEQASPSFSKFPDLPEAGLLARHLADASIEVLLYSIDEGFALGDPFATFNASLQERFPIRKARIASSAIIEVNNRR